MSRIIKTFVIIAIILVVCSIVFIMRSDSSAAHAKAIHLLKTQADKVEVHNIDVRKYPGSYYHYYFEVVNRSDQVYTAREVKIRMFQNTGGYYELTIDTPNLEPGKRAVGFTVLSYSVLPELYPVTITSFDYTIKYPTESFEYTSKRPVLNIVSDYTHL